MTYILDHTPNITSGYAVGDNVYGWADVEINDAILSDGPFVGLDDVGTSTVQYVGFNKGGNTTGYMPAGAGRLYMRTPTFAVQASNTGLLLKVRGQINAASSAGKIDLYVHSAGIKKVTSGFY